MIHWNVLIISDFPALVLIKLFVQIQIGIENICLQVSQASAIGNRILLYHGFRRCQKQTTKIELF